jgi:hypothetical protein
MQTVCSLRLRKNNTVDILTKYMKGDAIVRDRPCGAVDETVASMGSDWFGGCI